jgi:NADPH:quinone reductase-like Zn-dependent oxidoreductase
MPPPVEGRIVQIATQGGAKASADFSKLMVKRLTHTGSTLDRARGVQGRDRLPNWKPRPGRFSRRGRIAPVMDMIFPLKRSLARA